MKINDYQISARGTAIYPPDASVIYPAFGLIGELAEYCDKRRQLDEAFPEEVADAAKEMGDILWYCANLAADLDAILTFALDVNDQTCFDEVIPQHAFVDEVLILAGRLAEATKKSVRDGFTAAHRDRMLAVVNDAVRFVAQECEDLGLDLGEVAGNNIAKLRSRQERGVLKGDGDNR